MAMGWGARGRCECAASCSAPTARFRPARVAPEYRGGDAPGGYFVVAMEGIARGWAAVGMDDQQRTLQASELQGTCPIIHRHCVEVQVDAVRQAFRNNDAARHGTRRLHGFEAGVQQQRLKITFVRARELQPLQV
jgi:hypothetical protein